MQKIIPHMWFDRDAEAAVGFYCSVFSDGKVHTTSHYTEAGHDIHGMAAGTVLTVDFEIEGMRFTALNGGPHFTPNPSISFIVSRDTKAEVDALWEKLADGGTPLMPLDTYPFSERYGWIQDKYGFSWQLILPGAEGDRRPPIVPSLLFVGGNCGKAEESIHFYTSIFPEAKTGDIHRYGADQAPDTEGTVMYADFTLAGQWFAAMDSAHAHDFTFNEALSLMVVCETQEEIDHYWEKLSAVPAAEQCGWLKDAFGVSWQIVPARLSELFNDPEAEKRDRVMEALLSMQKLDIAAFEAAYEGK